MKILVINPNSSQEMTQTIDGAAKKYASSGTEITTVSLDGPEIIANAYDIAVQTPKVLALVEKNKKNYDYFIIACGFDPGLEACRVVTKNVIGMGEAAILSACAVAKRFAYLNSTPGSAAAVPDKLCSMGIDPGKCVAARPVGATMDAVTNRYEMLDAYRQLGKRLVEEDGAGAIVLSCAGMSDLKEHLEQYLKVPVIAGVISGVKVAEQFSTVPRK